MSITPRNLLNSLSKRIHSQHDSGKLMKIITGSETEDEAELHENTEMEEKEILLNITNYINGTLVQEEDESLISIFQGISLPPISLYDYIQRLVTAVNDWSKDNNGISSTGIRCALISVEYLERMSTKFTPRSIHRYFATAMLIAIKITEDLRMPASSWSIISGCRVEDVNEMELAFCEALKWQFFLGSKDYASQLAHFGEPVI